MIMKIHFTIKRDRLVIIGSTIIVKYHRKMIIKGHNLKNVTEIKKIEKYTFYNKFDMLERDQQYLLIRTTLKLTLQP